MEKNMKITKREYFERLIDVVRASGRGDAVELEMMLEHEIELWDAKSTRNKAKAAAKRAESDALTDAIYSVLLPDNYMSAEDVLTFIQEDYPEATRSKITARLSKLNRAGKVMKQPLPKNESGRSLMGYKIFS